MFLIRNLKNLYEFTVIPRFTLQLVPEKGGVDLMTIPIEVRGDKKFYHLNRNNVNRGDVNSRITVLYGIFRNIIGHYKPSLQDYELYPTYVG